MVLSVSLNTYTALQNARSDGIIIPRDFVWITAKDRSTGDLNHIGLWNGPVAITVPVLRPDTGDVVDRVYQPLAGRMSIPAIPMEMSLKIRSLTLKFSRLNAAVINAVRVYDPRQQAIEIHRGLLDKDSRKLVDPAHCRWDGLINRAPITRAKVGDDGMVELETVSHSRWLTMASGDKMDAHFFEGRGDQAGKYISTIWRVAIPWGQSSIVHGDNKRPKEHFFK